MLAGMFNPPQGKPFGATDFGEYPTSSDLGDHDWTYALEGAATYTIDIESDATGLSGKRARTNGTTEAQKLAYWDLVGSQDDVEILVLLTVSTSANNRSGSRILARGNTDADFYAAALGRTSVAVREMALLEVSNFGAPTVHTQPTEAWTNDVKQWVRFRLNGTAIKIRRWNYGSAEPTTWQIEITDATFSSGSVGLGDTTSNANWVTDYYWFSVGLDGATAPGPTG